LSGDSPAKAMEFSNMNTSPGPTLSPSMDTESVATSSPVPKFTDIYIKESLQNSSYCW